jgi:hypothetical protein
MPFALADPPIRSLAMPVLASGDQAFDSEVMLTALLDAAVHWLERGLPIGTIKIVVFAGAAVPRLQRLFDKLRAQHSAAAAHPPQGRGASPGYDFFVSYAHEDGNYADELVRGLMAARPELRVFQDKLALKTGDAWQAGLDKALTSCRKVIAVYSPGYLTSKMCQEEFNMARLRHRNSENGVLMPIYLRDAHSLPLYMETLQYIDCREADIAKLRGACTRLVNESG